MNQEAVTESGETQQERPKGQVIFDNITLWFILSIAISLLIYNGWGIVELLLVPAAP